MSRRSGINNMEIYNTSESEAAKKAKKFGKNYMSINFEINETYRLGEKDAQPIGDLLIAGKRISLTVSEINKLQETLSDGRQIFNNKLRMGMLECRN